MTYIAYLHCRALKQLGVVATLCSPSLSKGVRWSLFIYIVFIFTFHNIIYFLHHPHHFHFLHYHAHIFRPSPRMWQIFPPQFIIIVFWQTLNFDIWLPVLQSLHVFCFATICTVVAASNENWGSGIACDCCVVKERLAKDGASMEMEEQKRDWC